MTKPKNNTVFQLWLVFVAIWKGLSESLGVKTWNWDGSGKSALAMPIKIYSVWQHYKV